MMDAVVAAMLLVVPAALWGRALARAGRYAAHRRLELGTFGALAVTLVAFELEVRWRGWRDRAEPSPYYRTILFPWLYLHVTIAVTASALWIASAVHGLTRMPRPAAPGAGSRWHKRLGKATLVATCATAATGWVFFYLAFVA